MANAVLIIDMPESCDMCDFVEEQYPRMYCGVPGIGENVTDYIACRPDFCPLRGLPEKEETVHPQECYTNSYWTDKMRVGWNAYRDALLGKK